jgi:hypothetical protein
MPISTLQIVVLPITPYDSAFSSVALLATRGNISNPADIMDATDKH